MGRKKSDPAAVQAAEGAHNVEAAGSKVGQVNLKQLTADDAGVAFSRSLTPAAKVGFLVRLANEMRETGAKNRSFAAMVVALIEGCSNEAEAKRVFADSAKQMRTFTGDEKAKGSFTIASDQTLRSYKSTLLRGFRLGVLPSQSYLSEGEIRKRTKALGEKAAKEQAGKIAAAVNAGEAPSIPEEELQRMATTMHKEYAAWVTTLPLALQVAFWQRCEPSRVEIQKQYDKLRKALDGAKVEVADEAAAAADAA